MAQHHDDYLDRLAGVRLFADLDRHELEVIAGLGTDIEVEEGREVTSQGGPAHEAFLVNAGTASCRRDDVEIATFGPGDFFGEMALLIHGPRTATIVATSPLSLRAFHQSEFENLLESAPTVAVKILRSTAQRLLRAEDSPHH